MSRKKHDETEYEKMRKAYREVCPMHVVTFETDMTEEQKREIFRIAEDLRLAGNQVVSVMKVRLEQLLRTKKYRALQKQYGYHSERMKDLSEESPAYHDHEVQRKVIGKQMQEMQKQYKVTDTDTKELMRAVYPAYNLNSVFALTRAEAIWSAISNVLYGKGKTIHFKKRGDLPVIRAKQINRALPIHLSKNKDSIKINCEKVNEFGVIVPKNDLFLQDELYQICKYLQSLEKENTDLERIAVEAFQKNEFIEVFRPAYAALVCETIRGKLRVYVQITVAASPMPKKDKYGNQRHHFRKGRIGIDLGTQSCAVVSDSTIKLFNLAERSFVSTKVYCEQKKDLLRKMDRSRRASNPERYEKDGTYKKGSRGKWKNSKHYRMMQYKLHELERRNADSRKFAAQQDVNKLRSMGDVCIIEPPNAKKLQKRAEKTTREEKTSTITTKSGKKKVVHKYKKKKRFGKSVLHRIPGYYQAQLKLKFGDGYHEVPQTFRASQYDHELDTYIKKKLSERWHHLSNEKEVQRDLYSAFLLYCADNDFKIIDRNKCLKEFDKFWEKHQILIQEIIQKGKHICNSGIKAA